MKKLRVGILFGGRSGEHAANLGSSVGISKAQNGKEFGPSIVQDKSHTLNLQQKDSKERTKWNERQSR